MAILDERGYFWWHSEKVPSSLLASENGVYGRIAIDEKGIIELELDAHLPRARHAIDLILNNELEVADIVGILRASNSHIFLGEAYSAGRVFGVGSLSHEKIRAHYCIVATENIFQTKKDKFISSIDFSFDGYDEWVHDLPINIEETHSSYRVLYKKLKTQHENL